MWVKLSGCGTTVVKPAVSCFACYSAAANTMMHQCECCQEARTSQGQVELSCADGSKVQHSYTVVETCSCSRTQCVEGTTPKTQRRRRR